MFASYPNTIEYETSISRLSCQIAIRPCKKTNTRVIAAWNRKASPAGSLLWLIRENANCAYKLDSSTQKFPSMEINAFKNISYLHDYDEVLDRFRVVFLSFNRMTYNGDRVNDKFNLEIESYAFIVTVSYKSTKIRLTFCAEVAMTLRTVFILS